MRDRLAKCRVHVSKNLIDAMWSLERGACEIALVVDDDERLLGTLTDGDIRRAQLNGAGLDTPLQPWAQRAFTAVTPDVGRAEVIDLMRARTIHQIPILDGNGRLIGLHLLHEMIGSADRPNWAVIMAGGQGERLRPMTEHVPKPMLRVAGRPILERLVLHLVGFGVRRIFLSINYLGHLVEEHFGTGERFGCQIEYLREERPLGTAGSLSLLPSVPEHPLLVMNGDLVTQADIGAVLDAHSAARASATMVVRRYFHTVPFGCVDVEDGRIVHMEEKPRLMRLVNAGIYVLDRAVLGAIPKTTETTMPVILDECLVRGERVHAFEIVDDWIDVGQREQLDRARGLR